MEGEAFYISYFVFIFLLYQKLRGQKTIKKTWNDGPTTPQAHQMVIYKILYYMCWPTESYTSNSTKGILVTITLGPHISLLLMNQDGPWAIRSLVSERRPLWLDHDHPSHPNQRVPFNIFCTLLLYFSFLLRWKGLWEENNFKPDAGVSSIFTPLNKVVTHMQP